MDQDSTMNSLVASEIGSVNTAAEDTQRCSEPNLDDLKIEGAILGGTRGGAGARLIKSPSEDMEENSYYLHLASKPVRFEPLTRVTTVYFDEANRQVFTIRLNGLAIVAKGSSDRVNTMFSLPDKGEMKSIKFSPDLKILAVQRSPRAMDFVNFSPGAELADYSQTCKGKTAKVLSFYWTSNTEIVYVTDQGVEYYQVFSEKKNLKLIKTYSMSIGFSLCLNESQMILTASGTQNTTLVPFLFKGGVMTKLSKFDVELHPPSPHTAQIALSQEDITLATLYGSIYALVLRRGSMGGRRFGSTDIHLYNISTNKDVLVKKTDILRLNLDGHFSVNIVDNLIIVHHMTSKTSMIFDIKLTGEIIDGLSYHEPFVSPLPIRPFRLLQPVLSSSGAAEMQEHNCDLYSIGWITFQPDIIIDARLGCVWTLKLKLESLVSMITDKSLLVKFLLQRRGSKKVLLDLCRSLLSPGKQADLSVISAIYDSLNQAFSQHMESQAVAMVSRSSPVIQRDKQLPVIDQSDMYSHVFSVFDDSNYKFVVAVMIEYIRSLGVFHIPVQHFIFEFVITTLVHNKCFYQLHQFLQYHILADSKQLAYSLLSLESSYPPAYQLALDMLKRLGTANDSILEVLLSKQLLLSALRFSQKSGIVDQLPARKFLEVALTMNNDQLFFIMFKFFEQRNLRLRGSTQFMPGDHCDQYVEHFKSTFSIEALG